MKALLTGVFSNLHDNRQRLMIGYIQILDQIAEEKKKPDRADESFDFASEEDRQEYSLDF